MIDIIRFSQCVAMKPHFPKTRISKCWIGIEVGVYGRKKDSRENNMPED
jgi:hypothetical protein